MKLKVVSSGSVGNAYIIYNDDEALLLECGVRFNIIKQALNFKLSHVVGCLVTHSHLDHCKGARELVSAGIDLYCLKDTAETFGFKSHRIIHLPKTSFNVGSFKVRSFPLQHDVPCVGFIIEHAETGRFCFITDTYYCEYVIPGLNNIIVEANYCNDILQQRMMDGVAPEFLRNRVLQSHMSLATCKDWLKSNDLKAVSNILLIHLSDGNSDAVRFQKEIKHQTSCNVHVAEKGLSIDFNKHPF